MPVEVATFAYAATVGAAGFFSPCSVGLLPGYVGYHLSGAGGPDDGGGWRGARLGLAASAGFLALFAVAAGLVLLVPLKRISPVLPYVSLAIGGLILLVGLYLLLGGRMDVRLPRVEHSGRNVFVFGLAYALASLGCTFPLFASVALAGAGTGNAATAALVVLTYAVGMSTVMVSLTAAIGASQTGATRFLAKATPLIHKAAPVLMMAGGAYLIAYWTRALVIT